MACKIRSKNATILASLTAVLLSAAIPAGAHVLYVDLESTASTMDGLSWNTAFDDLQDAFAEAHTDPNVHVIRIANGTYNPHGDDREVSFVLEDGVAIEGGYAGISGSDPDARDWDLYPTILSGELSAGGMSDNSYHVITCDDTVTTRLEGLTIERGNANSGSHIHGFGGGIRNGYLNTSSVWIAGGTLTLDYCKFIDNAANKVGGGMSNVGHPATLTNCTFTSNNTLNSGEGGGAFNNRSVFGGGDTDSTFTDCVFITNDSQGKGGAFFGSGTTTVSFTRCTFDQNSSNEWGGAVHLAGSAANIDECDFTDNTSGIGGALSGGNDGAQIVAIEDTTFTTNSATNTGGNTGGGAIWSGGNVDLLRCTFDSNTAKVKGGAVYSEDVGGAFPEFAACIFDGNTAEVSGGAVYEESAATNVIYLNSLFVGNKTTDSTSGEGGGAIRNGGDGNTSYVNCTFVDNEARGGDGGGILFPVNIDAPVTNSIFWGNCDGTDCDTFDQYAQIGISGTSDPTTVKNSTIEGCDDPGFCPMVTTNFGTEPAFEGFGAHPYQLQAIPGNDDLIDGGDGDGSGTCPSDNSTSVDLARSTRFVEDDGLCDGDPASVIDIGAYEVQFP